MQIGDWVDSGRCGARGGRPLRAKTQDARLSALRLFFRDLQEWGLIPRRLSPERAFATPRAVRHKMGPDPRVIDSILWAKLLWAALHLARDDRPTRGAGTIAYPLELVRAVAVVWCFAGLRADEITRLRVGCIRWQRQVATPAGGSAMPPEDAICFLDVPVSKTQSAFTKAVHPLVGQRIGDWERVRPSQRGIVDHKTGQPMDPLFAIRGHGLSREYLNKTLIPVLCRKAGVPTVDERGPITSHRTRATIATMLYNAEEPLSLFELMAWLGHRHPASTQHYAMITPLKQAKAYARAGYFERNLATVEALLDLRALGRGEEGLFYDLGHRLCANPEWWRCKYRLACARCPFYRPANAAALIRQRAGLRRMREEIHLTPQELAALEGDAAAPDALLAADPPPAPGAAACDLPGFVALSEIRRAAGRPTPKAARMPGPSPRNAGLGWCRESQSSDGRHLQEEPVVGIGQLPEPVVSIEAARVVILGIDDHRQRPDLAAQVVTAR
jgi:integrase